MSKAYDRVVQALEAQGCQKGEQFCCPSHPDEHPSLSVSEGDNGRVLLKCHAGCATEDIVAALDMQLSDLFVRSEEHPMSELANTYDYRDEQGALFFQVCRFTPKGFAQRRPGSNGDWIWDLKGVRRVLYRLPDLLSRPDDPVFFVEGEKDADRLHGLGLVATTNPGGAGKWRPEFSESLRGREVVIIPDSDDRGRQHANEVASALMGIATGLKIVELPGLEEKGDVSDWLETHSMEELMGLVEATAEYAAGPDESEDAQQADVADSAQQSEDGRPSLAKILIAIVLGAGVELFHDQREDSYAAVPLDGGRRIMSLRSRAFSNWLCRLCWTQLGRALGSEAQSSVRNTLSGIALFDGAQHDLHIRCAAHDRALWIDLDGRRAVRVTPGRWEIVGAPPILFRPFPHQLPLPDPIPGGDPRHVLSFVNLRNTSDQTLLLCYLVAGFIPGIPITALIISGVQGSAKTTMQKIVKALLDPSAVAVRGGIRDPREFALAAFQNRVLFFDNLTSVPDWLSDALCRAVTGEGWSKRTLYTDEDATVLEYQGLVGLSGINLVADRADLLDRSLIMELEPVAPNERIEERQLWGDFEIARPQILGGLLDALSRAMLVEPGIKLRSLPRMADFARWGAAAAVGLRRNPKEFLDAYECNVGRQNEAAIGASPVAQALLAFMQSRDCWEGTPVALFDELQETAVGASVDTRSRRWPKSANWLSRRLKEVEPNLLALGLKVEVGTGRTAGSREVTVTTLPSSGGNAVTE